MSKLLIITEEGFIAPRDAKSYSYIDDTGIEWHQAMCSCGWKSEPHQVKRASQSNANWHNLAPNCEKHNSLGALERIWESDDEKS